MKKTWLALPVVLFGLAGILMTGCPTSDPDNTESLGPFSFAYKSGSLEISKNSWSGGSNNQAQLAGTFTGVITKDKTYKVKISGTLSHAVTLKVVLVDNDDNNWHILSNYGTVLDDDEEPVVHPAEALGNGNGIEFEITTTVSAGNTTASANKVVLIGENSSTDENKATDDLTITDAVILVAEKGQPYPDAPDQAGFQWVSGKPDGSKEEAVNWKKPNDWATADFGFDATISANAKVAYTLYIPKDATFSEYDEIQVQAAVSDPWDTIGIQKEIKITDFVSDGEYLKFEGSITGTNTKTGTALTFQINYGYVTYEGVIAIKLGAVTQ